MIRPVALVALVTSCTFAPPDAEPFDPPAAYRDRWVEAQACTGRRRTFETLRFFVVPGHSFECPSGHCAGHTEGKTIYIAEDWLDYPLVVKHEMIHALGIDGHPDRPFACPCHATWESYNGAVAAAITRID